MADIPYLYSKGKGQGFRVVAANKNAGVTGLFSFKRESVFSSAKIMSVLTW